MHNLTFPLNGRRIPIEDWDIMSVESRLSRNDIAKWFPDLTNQEIKAIKKKHIGRNVVEFCINISDKKDLILLKELTGQMIPKLDLEDADLYNVVIFKCLFSSPIAIDNTYIYPTKIFLFYTEPSQLLVNSRLTN